MTPRPEPADGVGAATLERVSQARAYNRWMFDRLRPWVGRRVLEIGAGIGNLSVFLADRERAVLSDTEPHYLDRLRERFAGRSNMAVVELELPNADRTLAVERFDTVVCLNVLEHIADDAASLRAIRALLGPGARLVVLVPALPALYGSLDEALGHHRRYTRRELAFKLEDAGFRLARLEYFNLAGIPGWWFAGRVLRRRLLPVGALRWYDALVPLFRFERLLPWRIGQSLIAVGEVPA